MTAAPVPPVVVASVPVSAVVSPSALRFVPDEIAVGVALAAVEAERAVEVADVAVDVATPREGRSRGR